MDNTLREAAEKLLARADWKVGGALSPESKRSDFQSSGISYVKTRDLARLRDALASQPPAPEQASGAPPANCRQRLMKDGKPYPRSSCAACGKWSPNAKSCDAMLSASPAAPESIQECYGDCEINASEKCLNPCQFKGRSKSSAAPEAAPQQQAESCPESHGECKNRHQCWEPCGELGKSEAHVKVYEPQQQAPLPPNEQLYKDMRHAVAKERAEQQQAQGEPEVVAVIDTWQKDGDRHADLKDWGDGLFSLDVGEHELITLQSHREAVALKDAENAKLRAALDECVAALQVADSRTSLVWPNKEIQKAFRAAITQAKEEMK